MLTWRYPDKPMEVTEDYLESLDDGWAASVKLNGWRCVVTWERGQVRAYTRHYMALAKALRRDDDFEPELLDVMRSLPVPDDSMIDGEWLGRRDVAILPGESYWMFDLLYFGGRWMGQEPLRQRWQVLWDLMRSAPEPGHARRVGLVPLIIGDLAQFYQAQKTSPLSEGIVAKRMDSTLIGDFNRSAKNPDWIKCKQVKAW